MEKERECLREMAAILHDMNGVLSELDRVGNDLASDLMVRANKAIKKARSIGIHPKWEKKQTPS